jgi:hypothetical protein
MMAVTGDITLATAPKIQRVVQPDTNLTAAFVETHQRYKVAAQFLKDIA